MNHSRHSRSSQVVSAALLTTIAVWLLAPWSIADEPTSPAKPSQVKRKQLRLQSASQTDSRPQPFRGGAVAGGSASAGGFASGGAGGNGFASGNAFVTGGGSVSGSGSDDNGYRSGYQDRKQNGMSARFKSGASSSGSGNALNIGATASGFAEVSNMAPAESTKSSSGSLRTSVNTFIDGDSRVIKSMSVVDGERISSTRIVTKQENITVRESSEDGVEVHVRKRGQRSRDARVYLADSMTEFATEQPEIYESIKKYVAGNPAEAMGVTDDISDLSKQMNSAIQANPAKQMLVDQLEKVLGEVGDNTQLESVIRQMIRDNQ